MENIGQLVAENFDTVLPVISALAGSVLTMIGAWLVGWSQSAREKANEHRTWIRDNTLEVHSELERSALELMSHLRELEAFIRRHKYAGQPPAGDQEPIAKIRDLAQSRNREVMAFLDKLSMLHGDDEKIAASIKQIINSTSKWFKLVVHAGAQPNNQEEFDFRVENYASTHGQYMGELAKQLRKSLHSI